MTRHPSLISLSHDHHHGLALALRCRKQALGQIKPMGTQGLRERAEEVHGFFAASLERHFQAEEEILFPLMRSCVPESQPLVEDLIEDHRRMRGSAEMLAESPDLAKILFDFGDLLERHIRREERELFSIFEKHVTQEEAERVKKEIEKFFECQAPNVSD